MPGDRKKQYKQSTGTVPKIKPYNVSSSPVSGEWSSTYANNITSYRHYPPDQHNLLSNRKGNHQNNYYTMESTVESYLPTVQNMIANETSSNTSSSNSRRNSSGSTLKCDNLTKYPDKNQVEQRLEQIREYLKITDSLMTSIRNTDEHTSDFSEIESLEKMTNDLKDSERKLVGILDHMNSGDMMNSEQADNATGEQSFHSTSSNIRNDINLDDPNHQMDALKEQQLSLMQLQQKAEYKLRSARQIQSNLLQAAANNDSTGNAAAPAKDVNNFDAAIADLEDRWKRLRPRRERPNNVEDAFAARIESLHERMLGMRAANNEREHLIEALDEQDAALRSEHDELQGKLLELQSKKTQVDRLVAQLESFGEEEDGDVGGQVRKIVTMKDQLEKLKDMLEIVKTTENIMQNTNQSAEVQAAASDICSTAENFLDKRLQQQQPVSNGVAGIVPVFRNGSCDDNVAHFRSGSHDGTVPNFRGGSHDGNVNNFRSGSHDGTVPNFRSGSYDGNVNNFRSGSCDGNVRSVSTDGNVNNVVRYDNDTSSNGRSKQVNKKNRPNARRVDNGQLTGANPKIVVHRHLDARKDLDDIVGKHKASISNLNHDVGNDAKSESNYWPVATNQHPPSNCDSPIFSTDEDDDQEDEVNLYAELSDNRNVASVPPSAIYSPSNSSKRRSSENASRNLSYVPPADVRRNVRGGSLATTGSREAPRSNVDQDKLEVRKQLYMMKNLIDSMIDRHWADANINQPQQQQQPQQNSNVLRNNLAPECAPNASAGALLWPAEANSHSNLNNDQGGGRQNAMAPAQRTEAEGVIDMLCQQLIAQQQEIEKLKSSFAQLQARVEGMQIASNSYVRDFSQNLLQPEIRQNLIQPDIRQNLLQPDNRQNLLQSDIRQNLLQPDNRHNLLQPDNRHNLLQPDVRQNLLQPDIRQNQPQSDNRYQSNVAPDPKTNPVSSAYSLPNLNQYQPPVSNMNPTYVNECNVQSGRLLDLNTANNLMHGVNPTVNQALPNQLWNGQALNNQVAPGNRANNYWDNFRSYSRQNLLSTKNADVLRNPSTSYDRSNELTAAAAAPPPKANADHDDWQQALNAAVAPPDVLNINCGSAKAGTAAAPVGEGAVRRAGRDGLLKISHGDATYAASLMEEHLMIEALERDRNLDGERSQLRQQNFDQLEALRENVLKEVTSLISVNESRPYYLIQLFRDLQMIETDAVRLQTIRAIQDIIITRFSTAEERIKQELDNFTKWPTMTPPKVAPPPTRRKMIGFRNLVKDLKVVLNKNANSSFHLVLLGALRQIIVDSVAFQKMADTPAKVEELAKQVDLILSEFHGLKVGACRSRLIDNLHDLFAYELELDPENLQEIEHSQRRKGNACGYTNFGHEESEPLEQQRTVQCAGHEENVSDHGDYIIPCCSSLQSTRLMKTTKNYPRCAAPACEISSKYRAVLKDIRSFLNKHANADLDCAVLASLKQAIVDSALANKIARKSVIRAHFFHMLEPVLGMFEGKKVVDVEDVMIANLTDTFSRELMFAPEDVQEQELPPPTDENGRDNASYGQESQPHEQPSIAAGLPQAVDNIQNGDLAEADQSRIISGHIEDEEEEESEVEEEGEEEEEGAVGGVLDIKQETESHQALRDSPEENEDSAASATEGLDQVPTRLPIVKSQSSTPSKCSKDAAGSHEDSDPF